MRPFFLILIVLSAFKSFGQVPYAYSFSEQHNFLSKTVYFLHEDSQQNIWMGTNYGLYKWNGNSFSNYKNTNYSVNYSSIQEDKTGRIWCQNFTGQIFYVENDSLKLFLNQKDNYRTSLCYIVDYFPNIYIGSTKGLEKLNFNTNSKSFINKKNISQLQTYKNGIIYSSSNNVEYEPLGKHAQKLFKIIQTGKIAEIPGLYQFDNKIIILGNLWINQKKKPYLVEHYEKNKFQKKHFYFSTPINVAAFFYDSTNNLIFLGTSSGLQILNKQYSPIFNGKILNGKNISDIIKDKEGNYWISTLNHGIFIIPSIEILSFDKKKFNNHKIISIKKIQNKKLLFVGEYGKIFEKYNNKIQQIGDINQKVEAISYDPFTNTLNFGNIISCFNIKKKTICKNIYGINHKSISYINPYLILNSSSVDASIKTNFLEKISDNLKKMLSKNANFIFHHDNIYKLYFRRKRSHHNVFDFENNNFYISYSDGLYFYNKGEEKEIFFKKSSILITALSQVVNGGVWCATVDGNLLYIENGKFKRNIRTNKHIKEILQWNKFIFLSTESGLLKINTQNEKQTTIGIHDGLPSNFIHDIEIVNDTLFVASEKDVSQFACKNNFINTIPPTVSFVNVAIWEKDTVLQDSYFLPHYKNNITIYFKAIATRSRKNYIFKYRMKGIDSTWRIQKSEINFVRFPSIIPNDYTFQLKAVNEDGFESKIISIKITVDAPIYLKWWFIMLLAIFAFFLASFIYIIRINIIEKRNSILNDKKDVENQLLLSQRATLRLQMNPHFVFNALNSIQSYIILNDKELASDYLGLFADLMRKFLYFSQKEEISIEEEIEILDTYLELEKLRFEDSLNYKISVSSDLNTSEIMIPVMLIQPLVENSIKHGLFHKKDNRILEISFVKQNNNLLVIIRDNGIGRKQSAQINKMQNKKHKSFATSALQQRISLINKSSNKKISLKYTDLYNKNKQAEGTLVEIKI